MHNKAKTKGAPQRIWAPTFLTVVLPSCALLLLAPRAAAQDEYPEVPGAPPERTDALLADKLGRFDAANDEWTSEGWSDQLGARLKTLAECWSGGGTLELSLLEEYCGPGATSDALRPRQLEPAAETPAFSVLRPAAGAGPAVLGDRNFEGPAGMYAALAELAAPFGGEAFRSKFKIIGVQEDGDVIVTRVRYHASSMQPERAVQQNAIYVFVWETRQAAAPPLLTAIRRESFEEIHGRPAGGPLFSDCTRSVFATEGLFEAQFLPGHGDWRRSISALLGVSVMGEQGLAVADIDGDGLEDLYLCQPAGLPNRLLRHRPNGTLVDISKEAGVDLLDMTTSALFLDLDNDGDPDLVLAMEATLLFFENDGTGKFSVRGEQTVEIPMSMAAADYDLDGDLDLYVCGYFSPYADVGVPLPYHDANNGSRSSLLRNDGDFRFLDVTTRIGLDQNNRRFSFAAAWEDYDGDGDPDLYVANDFGRNNLYRNDGGHFVDVAGEAGVEDIAAGMGVTWGDYDQDGDFDLYVSNMDSSAGKRVTYQRRFKSDAEAPTRARFQRHARGNTLFENLGDGTFADRTDELGVASGLWAWGSVFADLDLDGRLDIAVPNGFVTGNRADDL